MNRAADVFVLDPAAPCAIWWLTQQDEAAIGPEAPEDWPIWLRAEYRSLCGRLRRGRLWVSGRFTVAGIPWPDPETPLARRLGGTAGKYSAGGIVVSADVVLLLADMPGMLTDLSLRRLGWPEVAAVRLAGIREAVMANGSTPYPLLDVLRIFADAADHLHEEHNCDAHGWEVRREAASAAREIIAELTRLAT